MCTERLDALPGIVSWEQSAAKPQQSPQFPMSDYYLADLLTDTEGQAYVLAANLALHYRDRQYRLAQLSSDFGGLASQVDLDLGEYGDDQGAILLTSAVKRGTELWAAVSESPASLILFRQQPDGRFVAGKRRFINLEGHMCRISDMLIHNDELLVLIPDRWVIGSCPISDVDGPTNQSLVLTAQYSLRNLKSQYLTQSSKRNIEGLAESMAIREDGAIFILLSGRGYRFDGTGADHAILLQMQQD